MASTLLERTRALHEDRERYEKIAVEVLLKEPRNHKETVVQSHTVNLCLESIKRSSEQLKELYEDKDNLRKDEIAAIVGSGPSLFSTFYDRVREIKEYHRKFPSVGIDRPENDVSLTEDEVSTFFAGEEGFGRYLDLHEFYDRFVNLFPQKKKHLDYLDYLGTFYKFKDKREFRIGAYKTYLSDLLDYILDFFHRSEPMFDLGAVAAQIREENEKQYNEGAFTSWEPETDSEKADPLYCKACEKLFSKDTVFQGHLKGKKHIKAAEKLSAADQSEDVNLKKEIFLLEAELNRLGELLTEKIEHTKMNIEKKQGRTAKEIEMELEQAGGEEEIEEEPEEEVKIGIQNYPVGWDGRPIPYWLYKLHGLGIEYKCEICANTSYWGRRAFERHFQEWRHAYGMRCLKIPNTRHFHEVTKIADAVELYKKIQEDNVKFSWKPDVEEEYEDGQGNVVNKKTFQDLKRQGLLDV